MPGTTPRRPPSILQGFYGFNQAVTFSTPNLQLNGISVCFRVGSSTCQNPLSVTANATAVLVTIVVENTENFPGFESFPFSVQTVTQGQNAKSNITQTISFQTPPSGYGVTTFSTVTIPAGQSSSSPVPVTVSSLGTDKGNAQLTSSSGVSLASTSVYAAPGTPGSTTATFSASICGSASSCTATIGTSGQSFQVTVVVQGSGSGSGSSGGILSGTGFGRGSCATGLYVYNDNTSISYDLNPQDSLGHALSTAGFNTNASCNVNGSDITGTITGVNASNITVAFQADVSAQPGNYGVSCPNSNSPNYPVAGGLTVYSTSGSPQITSVCSQGVTSQNCTEAVLTGGSTSSITVNGQNLVAACLQNAPVPAVLVYLNTPGDSPGFTTTATPYGSTRVDVSVSVPASAASAEYKVSLAPYGSGAGSAHFQGPPGGSQDSGKIRVQGLSTTITSIVPSADAQGAVGLTTIQGTNFGPAPQVTIEGVTINSVNVDYATGNLIVAYTVPTGTSVGSHVVTVINNLGVPAITTFSVILTQMKLDIVSAAINRNNHYSEDTTIRITAVRSDNGATVPNWAGTVGIVEDTSIPGYVTIYTQHADLGANLPPSVTIAGGSGGSFTFTAQSLADPTIIIAPPSATRPLPALIKPVGYSIFGGLANIQVPQWITSGQIIDPHAMLDPTTGIPTVYDWVQARTADIFNNVVPDSDLQTVLDEVSGYNIEYISDAYGETMQHHGGPGDVTINPYDIDMRLDRAIAPTDCAFTASKLFTETLIHEARHAYQGFVAISAYDQDMDYLLNTPLVVESSLSPTSSGSMIDVLIDSTETRTVCIYTGGGSPTGLQGRAYLGDVTADDPDRVYWAQEYDAETFATRHETTNYHSPKKEVPR